MLCIALLLGLAGAPLVIAQGADDAVIIAAPDGIVISATPDVLPPSPPEPPRARYAQLVHEPERYTLANGLDVVLDPMPGIGSVAVVVVYHVGARDQPAGYTGLAHLSEHMMFEGSLHAPGHFLDALDEMGASDRNGMTSRDATTYYEVVPPEQLERALYLEADRMAFLLPAMSEARIANQRAVVLRERTERVDLGGLGILPGLMASVLYPQPHPYAELFEHREDVEALRYRHVAWFVQTWYAPDGATLAISGDLDRERTRAAIERWFGPIRRTGTRGEAPPASGVTQLAAERRLVIEAPVRRDQLIVVWPTPAWGAPGDGELDLIALELETRLRERLVTTGRASSVDVSQRSYELASELQVTIETGRRRGTLEALEALDTELARLRDAPLPSARVAQLQRAFIDHEIESMESPMWRATLLASRIRSAPDGRWSLRWNLERRVTPDAVMLQRTVQQWLPSHGRLVLSMAAHRDAPIEGRVAVDLTIPPGGALP